MIPLVTFCPRCKKRINVPKFVGNINVLSGFITLECADKKCGGKAKLKTKQKEVCQMQEEGS